MSGVAGPTGKVECLVLLGLLDSNILSLKGTGPIKINSLSLYNI